MRFLYFLFCFFFFLITFFCGAFFWLVNHKSIDFSILENYNPGKPSVLLDDEGNEWARFELDRRVPIKLHQMPKHLIQAFIAAEDREFFFHNGVSIRGMIRSTLVNLKNGRIVQGASTITQQLVKLLFFDSRRTFKRKIKEQFFSILVELQFTKEQILETYLNHVYFGCGIYGVSAACKRFFNKDVSEIDPSESAVLAGVQKCPAVYCPLLCPLSSEKRRNLILKIMAELKFISDDEYELYKNKALEVYKPNFNVIGLHLKETLRLHMESLFGKEMLYTGGLIIQTTLNRKLQEIAEEKFKNKFIQLKRELGEDIDGALVSIDVKSGDIKALIGGFNYKESQYNRALKAKRQMGSIFKPLVYSCAIMQGKNFAALEVDEPLELISGGHIWKPQNHTCKFEGEMTLARALSLSNNSITIKTLLNVGYDPVVDLAIKSGIKGPINKFPALSLGCVDVTPLEAAASFNIFANSGTYVKPNFLKWVKDPVGNKLFSSRLKQRQVLDNRVTDQVSKVLEIGIRRYLKSRELDFEAIGKTGTTNDSRTCWFSGATPELTTTIYIGRDDNRSLGKNIFPVYTLFPIWFEINKEFKINKKKFVRDPSLKEVHIDWVTGKEVNSEDTRAVALLL
jgi:membrane carboxypeptidase/penicillin-binding protein